DPHLSPLESGTVTLLSTGNSIKIYALNGPVRFLLLAGRPIGEPISWHGPIVMNTKEELELAFGELNKGTFIKR
ncbi:MAG: pirin-like C-terminal cupin domain-containing protein, partial [bacterium]|nr:pirin-like C-terminal cupin domain-containing protein [bacterium]